MLKRLEREFCTFLAMVHTCSNFGYEDFWAFLVCVYIYKKKKIRDYLEFIILEIKAKT